eukprot:TRINITY_DN6510_c0_g1_i1.p1 TRINITY_DN6510_c0_g1~~TRINITY_DN6510_c0_g1_i1.p1  ORF type:complete len:1337 (-),score=210.54 TRINITY_DN6510_c0_g1_i1:93-4103(-)
MADVEGPMPQDSLLGTPGSVAGPPTARDVPVPDDSIPTPPDAARVSYEEDEEEEPFCRVCRCPSEPDHELYAPCLCSGSIKWIHDDCLLQWLQVSYNRSGQVEGAVCELCATPFKFSNVYADNAPSVVSWWDFVEGIGTKAWDAFKGLMRIVFVIFLWVICLPFCSTHLAKIMLSRTWHELLHSISLDNFLLDCLIGIVIAAGIVLVILGVSGYRDRLHNPYLRSVPVLFETSPLPAVRMSSPQDMSATDGNNDAEFKEGEDPEAAQWLRQGSADGSVHPLPRIGVVALLEEDSDAGSDSSHCDGGPSAAGSSTQQRSNNDLSKLRTGLHGGEQIGSETVISGTTSDLQTLSTISGYFSSLGGTASLSIDGGSKASHDDIRGAPTSSYSENGTTRTGDRDSVAASSSRGYTDMGAAGSASVTTGYDYDETTTTTDHDHAIEEVEGESVDGNDTDPLLVRPQPPGLEREALHPQDQDPFPPIPMPAMAAGGVEVGGHGEHQVEAEHAGEHLGDDEAGVQGWGFDQEEMDFEELLGLRGSVLDSCENSIAVISFNAVFLTVFAGFPFHMGRLIMHLLSSRIPIAALIEGTGIKVHERTVMSFIIITMIGYWGLIVLFGMWFSIAYYLRARMIRPYDELTIWMLQTVNHSWTLVKIFTVMTSELLFFPICAGWWIDLCTLQMLGATLSDRLAFASAVPVTSLSYHWVLGIAYMIIFSSGVSMIRTQLRPHVLWFLRNPDDPEHRPLQDMIELPMHRHIRRLLTAMLLNGTFSLCVMWGPIQVVRWMIPSVFPIHVSLVSQGIGITFSLFHIVLPKTLEILNLREIFLGGTRWWFETVARILDLESYLLERMNPHNHNASSSTTSNGNTNANGNGGHLNDPATADGPVLAPVPGQGADPAPAPPRPEDAGSGQEEDDPEVNMVDEYARDVNRLGNHLNNSNGSNGHNMGHLSAAGASGSSAGGATAEATGYASPYITPPPDVVYPPLFRVRISIVLVLALFTIAVYNTVAVLFPLILGRWVFSLIFGSHPMDAYAAIFGVVFIWLGATGAVLGARAFAREGSWRRAVLLGVFWLRVVTKCCFCLVLGALMIPLLIGLCLNVTFLSPFARIPLTETPVVMTHYDWFIGMVYFQGWIRLVNSGVLTGAAAWKDRFQTAWNDGVQGIRVGYVVRELIIPLAIPPATFLAVPYTVTQGLLPALGIIPSSVLLIASRFVWFAAFCILALLEIAGVCENWFKVLNKRIKDDKYLVGRRVLNHDRHSREAEQVNMRSRALSRGSSDEGSLINVTAQDGDMESASPTSVAGAGVRLDSSGAAPESYDTGLRQRHVGNTSAGDEVPTVS